MKKEDIYDISRISGIIIVVTIIFYFCIKTFFSVDSDAATITSSLIMAIITAIYVKYTYRIFETTNKNTEQTANAQKIKYLERSLQLFYLPMQRALKTIDMTKLKITLDTNSDAEKSHIFKQSLIDMFLNYDKEYLSIMIFSYFATDKTNEYLTGFKDVYSEQIQNSVKLLNNFIKVRTWYFSERDDKSKYELAATDKTGFFNYYVLTKLQIEEDIQCIKAKLAELVNA